MSDLFQLNRIIRIILFVCIQTVSHDFKFLMFLSTSINFFLLNKNKIWFFFFHSVNGKNRLVMTVSATKLNRSCRLCDRKREKKCFFFPFFVRSRLRLAFNVRKLSRNARVLSPFILTTYSPCMCDDFSLFTHKKRVYVYIYIGKWEKKENQSEKRKKFALEKKSIFFPFSLKLCDCILCVCVFFFHSFPPGK